MTDQEVLWDIRERVIRLENQARKEGFEAGVKEQQERCGMHCRPVYEQGFEQAREMAALVCANHPDCTDRGCFDGQGTCGRSLAEKIRKLQPTREGAE